MSRSPARKKEESVQYAHIPTIRARVPRRVARQPVPNSASCKHERRGDRPAARHGDFVCLARVVAEATRADERGRAAPVKVQRLARAKAGHRRRELVNRRTLTNGTKPLQSAAIRSVRPWRAKPGRSDTGGRNVDGSQYARALRIFRLTMGYTKAWPEAACSSASEKTDSSPQSARPSRPYAIRTPSRCPNHRTPTDTQTRADRSEHYLRAPRRVQLETRPSPPEWTPASKGACSAVRRLPLCPALERLLDVLVSLSEGSFGFRDCCV
jgi:hypothetical protein